MERNKARGEPQNKTPEHQINNNKRKKKEGKKKGKKRVRKFLL
jgi:hypothetical protein